MLCGSVVPDPDFWSPILPDYKNFFGSGVGLDISFAQAGYGLSKTVCKLASAVPKLFGCWAKFATLSVSEGRTVLCIEKNKTKKHTHNIRHVCTLQFFSVFDNMCAM